MDNEFTLADLAVGESCLVRELRAKGSMRRRLLDIGVVEGAPIVCVGKSPAGDPSAYLLCGAVIAIRARDAHDVLVCR